MRLNLNLKISFTVGKSEICYYGPLKVAKPATHLRHVIRPDRDNDSLSLASNNSSVKELRERLGRHEGLLEQWRAAGESVTDELLWRWCKSKGSAEEAEKCLTQHIAWRADLGQIKETSIQSELDAEKVFLQGCDVLGRPIVIVLAARHVVQQRNLDETKLLITFTLDTAVEAADTRKNSMGQILCLFDLSGLGLSNLDSKALRAVFEVLQRHFPECLSELWFLNAPFIFWGLWRVVAPFIHPATRSKIQFLSGAQRTALLQEHIPPKVVEAVPTRKAANA